MQHAVFNSSGKIWALCEGVVQCTVVRNEEQQLTLKLYNQAAGIEVLVTLAYAKYTPQERIVLWESLADMSQTMSEPWIVGKDFNVVTSIEEKLRGLPITLVCTTDFNHCISLHNLKDTEFKGSKFTWWNERVDEDCIFERLDKVLWNNWMQNLFLILKVEHMTRTGSDHAPLLLQFTNSQEKNYKII